MKEEFHRQDILQEQMLPRLNIIVKGQAQLFSQELPLKSEVRKELTVPTGVFHRLGDLNHPHLHRVGPPQEVHLWVQVRLLYLQAAAAFLLLPVGEDLLLVAGL